MEIKAKDKVKIHCHNRKNIAFIYDNQIGEVEKILDINKNPWGNYCVRLDNGCSNCFYKEELELV